MAAKLALLTSALALLLLAGCSTSPQPSAAGPAPAAAATPPAAPSSAPESEAVLATGPIVVELQVDLSSQRDGVIAELKADLGTTVQKGDVLALLEDKQVRAEREAQAARVRSIEADLLNWESETKVRNADRVRAEEMWKARLITEQQLQHAQYRADATQYEVDRERENLRHAQETLKALDAELAKTRITAPFSGVIARRYVSLGQKVAQDDRIFWLTATSPMRIKFMLPERMIGEVKMGAEFAVMPSALSGDTATRHKARVVRLSPVVDPATGSFEVIAEIAGPAGDLRPGMNVNILAAAPAR